MRYEVDSGQVDQAAAAVNTTAASITGEVDAMMRHLTQLQNSWRGSAAASFQEVLSQWRGTQRQVEQSLSAIRTALASAATHYAGAEEQAMRLFTR